MAPLHTVRWGKPGAPVLVLLHGFTQTAHAWGRFGSLLGEAHQVIAVDLPGHGGSSELDLNLMDTADALLETIGEGPVDVVGYSLGGRVALHGALRDQSRMRSLTLIGSSPGIDSAALRAERRAADDAIADRLAGEGDLEAFLDRWLGQALFATLPAQAQEREARRANSVDGLARSLRSLGAGTQQPLWALLGQITIPLLFIAGSKDRRYRDLGARVAASVQKGTLLVVNGAGHACHLERADVVARGVTTWLDHHHGQPHASPTVKSTPTTS